MKIKAVIFFILFSWIFQVAFPYFQFEIRRRDCWQQFLSHKDHFEPEAVSQFCFGNMEEVHWEKKNREFILDGKFYDVLEIENADGNINVSCVADEDEDELLRSYENFLKRHQQKSGKKLKKVSYFVEKEEPINFRRTEENESSLVYQLRLYSVSVDVTSPPPDLMS